MRSSLHGPCARTAPRRWVRTATVGPLRAAVLARSRAPLRRAKLPASRTTRCVPALRARKSIVRKGNKADFAFLPKNCLFRASTSHRGRRPFSLGELVGSPSIWLTFNFQFNFHPGSPFCFDNGTFRDTKKCSGISRFLCRDCRESANFLEGLRMRQIAQLLSRT